MNETTVSHYFDAQANAYSVEVDIDEMETVPLVDECIDDRCTEGDRLLEIGCGNGQLLEYVLEYTDVTDAVGIDVSTEMLPDPHDDVRAQYLHASATDLPLPFERESFDFVVLSDVLHHLVGPTRSESKRRAQAALVEATNLLRPGGYLIVKEIYYESPLGPDTLTSHLIFFGLKHGSRLVSRIERQALPGLLVSFYTRDELLALLRQSGAKPIRWSLESGPDGSTLQHLLTGESGCIRLYARKTTRDERRTEHR